jgi:hypothetical protein
MATVASLFGPSAEEIVFARKKEEEDAARQKYLARMQGAGQGLGPFAWAARAGVDVGETLRTAGGMFGEQIEDPLIKKYNRINQILVEEGGDLNDPVALKRVADKLQAEGYTNEAVRLYDRSSVLSTQARELALQESQYGPATSNNYVDIEGNFVKEDKAGNFYDMQGNPLNPVEVIGRDVFFDTDLAFNPQRKTAIQRGRDYRAGLDVSPRDNYVETDISRGDSSETSQVSIDTDAAKAETDRKIAKAEAEREERLREGETDLIKDPQTVGAVISQSGADQGPGALFTIQPRDNLVELSPDSESAREEFVTRDDSDFNYIDPNKFEFRPGAKDLDPSFTRRNQQQGTFEFRPDLADTGGLFKDDMRNIANLDQSFVPSVIPSTERDYRTLTPSGGPEYSPELMDAVRLPGTSEFGPNPENLAFGQKSTRSGNRDPMLIDIFRGDSEPTEEDYIDYLEALAKLDPEAYGSLYNDVKRGVVKMTKELGKSIRRLLPNSPTEFY